MKLVRLDPFEDLRRMLDEGTHHHHHEFALDVYQEGENIVAEMQVPGVKASDIDVSIEGDLLRVCGKREAQKEKKDKNYYYKEIRTGSFERVVRLPHEVDANKTSAEVKNGMLKVIAPKTERHKHNKIAVTVK